jgi:hypothetical protein
MRLTVGMQLPGAAQLISAWEQGTARHPVDRALALLAAAYPKKTHAELAALPIGRRDACLLEFREALFGPALDCYAECPRCQARLEFRADVRELKGLALQAVDNDTRELTSGDLHLRFRVPNSADLGALAGCRDVAAARTLLLEKCVLAATHGDDSLDLGEIPAQAIEELSTRLGESEGCADISFALACAACGHSWQLAFDIVSFLWSEISLLAKRYLYEVHTLAWAYGWREADILGMSPARRQFYLERVG